MKKKPARRFLIGDPKDKAAKNMMWGNIDRHDSSCLVLMTAEEARRAVQKDAASGIKSKVFEVLPAKGFDA